MTSQQLLEGNWNEIKDQLRQKWGQLTDNDFPQVRGDVDHLVGIIQRKTGEGREAIEAYLQRLSSNTASAIGTAAETVRDGAQHAVEAAQHTAKQAADQIRAGYDGAERLVRNRPGESLAVCFGVGLITGVVLALALRSR
ncbi:MAG: CsbD family protein [Planctomycetota bacterium]|nr:CsbD family protein [Planctomycetota bacterium]